MPRAIGPAAIATVVAAAALSAPAPSHAAMVQRLWELNGETISSGDPDLILPGQRLRIA